MGRKKHAKFAKRIEICGGIASGKTTLATKLIKHPGAVGVFENFQANPFFSAFYTDPEKYAFETEVTFLLQHYHQIKSVTIKDIIVCDFSLLLDRAYVDVTLSGSTQHVFLNVYNEIMKHLPPPELMIHLNCSAEEELKRIRKRARVTEESITLEYLDQINHSVEFHVSRVCREVRTLSIKSDRHNFAEDGVVEREIVNQILFSITQ